MCQIWLNWRKLACEGGVGLLTTGGRRQKGVGPIDAEGWDRAGARAVPAGA